MARSFDIYGSWVEHNNKIVLIDKVKYRIKAESYMARYPYEQRVVSVHAEPVNKKSKMYLEHMREYRDHWSIDVLDSDIELQAEILSQLQKQEA